MNKKLLSLAVAAALAAPASVALADATLYGKLHISLDYADITDGFKGWGMGGKNEIPGKDRASRFGMKGSEDLGNGLKAIYQLEFGVSIVDTTDNLRSNDGDISLRNSFVGLASDSWGTILAGRHDSPMKISTGKLDLFGDTMADMNGTIGFDDERLDNAIAYISPNFAGFQLMAATVVAGGANALGTGNEDSRSLSEGYSVAGIYSNGPFYGTVSYEEFGTNLVTTTGGDASDFTKWRVGLGLLDWNGFTLTGIYESDDNTPLAINPSSSSAYYGTTIDLDMWQIQAGYSFGNNMVKAMYGQGERDSNVAVIDDSDYSAWAIGFDHSFSKRTKVYALYVNRDDDLGGDFTYNSTDYYNGDGTDFGTNNLDYDGFSLGIVHSF